MSGSLVRLLMVFCVCACVCAFLVTSCVLKQTAMKTPEERKMDMLQDAYIACLRQTGKANIKGCHAHVESLKTPFVKGNSAAITTPP